MTDESRLTFVGKGVGAFFAFLLLFFGVSTYFGGGIPGIAVSIVLAVGVALGLLLLWPSLREQTQATPTLPAPPAKAPRPSNSGNRACPPGPYAVISDTPTRISLSVEAGDIIDGYVEEI